MRKFLIALLVAIPTLASTQLVISPTPGGGTTIINNNTTNVTNTTGTFLSEGGQVAWISGYQYTVSAATYYINNVRYTSAQQSITLDAADPTNSRIDVLVLNDSGTFTAVKGTAAADPSEPSINPGTQLELVLVLVTANSTEPANITNTTVYYDNTGSPTEWDCTTSGTGFDCNSTTNPKSPSTKDIEGTNVTSGSYAQLAIGSGNFNPATAESLILSLRSKAGWNNKRGLQIGLFSSGVLKGQQVVINRSGTWGFNSTITTSYQQIVIPLSNFNIPAGATINQIRIADFGGAIGFYLDDIFFQGGAVISTSIPIPYTFVPLIAGCQGNTSSLGFSTPVSNPAVAACVTGTNTQYAVAQFADSSNLSVQAHIPLPLDWSGTLSATGFWRTSATSGSVVWQLATICVGDASTGDPAFNTSSTTTEAAKGTTLQFNAFTITPVTVTGCVAGNEMFIKFYRDASHGSDDLAATADLISLTLLVGRAQ